MMCRKVLELREESVEGKGALSTREKEMSGGHVLRDCREFGMRLTNTSLASTN